MSIASRRCVLASVVGREEKVAGFDAYVASPDRGAADEAQDGGPGEPASIKSKRNRCAVVVLPDAIGFKEEGVRNLVDELARIGYETRT